MVAEMGPEGKRQTDMGLPRLRLHSIQICSRINHVQMLSPPIGGANVLGVPDCDDIG